MLTSTAESQLTSIPQLCQRQPEIPLLRSCERCRRRKQRCDGSQPTCGRCHTHQAECVYRQSGRFRKRFPMRQSSTPSVVFATQSTVLDPVEVLKTRELPDLTQSIPDTVLQQMWSMVGGLEDDAGSTPSAESAASSADDIPEVIAAAGRRHRLPETPQNLHAMLRSSFVDSVMKLRNRQLWATIESGTIDDLSLLIHLTVATREAQLSKHVQLAGGGRLEARCFEAVQQEWETAHGVRPSTGVVYALLLMSEYGFQSGRHGVFMDFAERSLATAQRIVVRGHPYPWHGARRRNDSGSCDREFDHLLAAFWCAWARVLTASEVLARRFEGPQELPEFDQHEMCHYTAQPIADASRAPSGAIYFEPDLPCNNQPHFSYSAATWQCYLLSAEIHNHYVDVLEGRGTLAGFFGQLAQWDKRMQAWRESWPHEWVLQLREMATKAGRVSRDVYGGQVPLDADWPEPDACQQAGASTTSSSTTSSSPQSVPMDVRPVNTHLYYETKLTAAEQWLVISTAMFENTKLHAHGIALALLRGEDARPVFANRQAVDLDIGQLDPMVRELRYHASTCECLSSARNLQNLFTVSELLGSPLERLGIWVILILDHTSSVHCQRLLADRLDLAMAADSIRRLARLLSQLLTLKRWTSALVVFTSVIKRFVDPQRHLVSSSADEPLALRQWVETAHRQLSDSPWPSNHVLTLLMHEMHMQPKQFCAYTMPVVYASAMSSPAMPQSMRMRITSLLS